MGTAGRKQGVFTTPLSIIQIYRKKARVIMERHLGKFLSSDENVHHKDGDVANNNINNLELMSRGDHSRHHNLGRDRSNYGPHLTHYIPEETRRHMSEVKRGNQINRGRVQSQETKDRIRKSVLETLERKKRWKIEDTLVTLRQ